MYPNNANQYLPGTIFIPSSMVIIAITQTNPMIVTAQLNPATEANTYIIGMLIKLNVPQAYKMWQANGLTGQIIAISGLNFSLNIDATQFDPFVIPSDPLVIQPATLAPSGSRNVEFNNFTALMPFQPLNDIGN